ncbi:unnamed protein product, partial [Effrenium voratum]
GQTLKRPEPPQFTEPVDGTKAHDNELAGFEFAVSELPAALPRALQAGGGMAGGDGT